MPKILTIYPPETNQMAASFIIPDQTRPTLFERLGWLMVWTIYLWMGIQIVVMLYRVYWK